MGAPKHNTNALKNGSRAMYRLVVGAFPAKWTRPKRHALRYRRDLEAAVVARYGSVDAMQAHHIHAAASWILHSGILRQLLVEKSEFMSPSDVARCSPEIASAAEKCAKLVKTLKVDAPDSSLTLAAFYSSPTDELAEPEAPASPETIAPPVTTAESSDADCACERSAQEPAS